jgi:hypothetical protein
MHVSGNNVILNVTAVYNDSPYLPQSATFRVIGPGDLVISDWSTVDPTGFTVGSIRVTIPGVSNTLVAPNVVEARIIELNVVAGSVFSGFERITADYVIERDAPSLTLMTNSFQLYTDSLALVHSLGSELENWGAASVDDRISSMSVAFNFLSRLNYEIYYDHDDVYFKQKASWGLPYMQSVGRLYAYSPDQFLLLDPDFIMSIRKAQIVEADVRLGGDTSEAIRSSGVLSEKTGPSETVYRAGKPLDLMVSRKALKYLSGYIKYNIRTSRS